MEKNSEPSKTFTHMVKRFLTEVVRSFNGGKTVFPKMVMGEPDTHMPRNEAQFSSVSQLCLTLCDSVDCSTPGLPFITTSGSLLKLISIELVMPSNRLILCWSFLLPSSIFRSIRVFSNETALHIRWPKYWSFSFGFSPSTKYSELIAFRVDWLDLLAVQGTLKSLLQQHSSKASILQCSAFFIVQLSHPYMTTGKTTGLIRWTSLGKVMSLLLHMLSRLVITFPKEQASFNFMAAVTICRDSGAQNIVCHCVPIYLPWSDGIGCRVLSLLNFEL